MFQFSPDELRERIANYLTVYLPKPVKRAMSEPDREQLVTGIVDQVFGKHGRLLFPEPVPVPDNLTGGSIDMDVGWNDDDPDPAASVPSWRDTLGRGRQQRQRERLKAKERNDDR